MQPAAIVGLRLRVDSPTENQGFLPGELVNVGGIGFDRGLPEPATVESVTVKVDDGPVIQAVVKLLPFRPPKTETSATFTAQVRAPSSPGQYTITVTATDDSNAQQTQIVTIFVKGHGKQPQRILEIQYQNPDQPKNVDLVYAQTVALGKLHPTDIIGGTFPSIDAQQEWKQVLPTDLANTAAHEADYEVDLVGATGWLLNPGFSDTDVPFHHPFGFDWEFMLALDQPDDNPTRYTFLLTPGDESPDEEGVDKALEQARDNIDLEGKPIPVPSGPDGLPSLLGVEMDGGLVPQQFTDVVQGVQAGDRMAVFGRWIVDCGHQLPVPVGGKAFRTEIHPPLLMASARVTAAADGGEATSVMFTSRPYLVGQRFVNPPGLFGGPSLDQRIYDDTFPDDGPFVSHLVKELLKVVQLQSKQMEAHPKIKSQPFHGLYTPHFVVRPPLPPHGITHGPLTVSFQFTVRKGCAVRVTSSSPDSIDVFVVLNSTGYSAPPLPNRRERTWTRKQLADLAHVFPLDFLFGEVGIALISALANPAIAPEAAAAALTILEVGGIKTDEYDINALRSVNILDRSHAVSAVADNIPAGQGVLEDNNQPYPVFGWLEVKYARLETQ